MSKNGLITDHWNISFGLIFVILFTGPTGRVSTGVTKAAESTGVSWLSASLEQRPKIINRKKMKIWKLMFWCRAMEDCFTDWRFVSCPVSPSSVITGIDQTQRQQQEIAVCTVKDEAQTDASQCGDGSFPSSIHEVGLSRRLQEWAWGGGEIGYSWRERLHFNTSWIFQVRQMLSRRVPTLLPVFLFFIVFAEACLF